MIGIPLLNKGSLRQPASVIISVGSEGNEVKDVYGALKSVKILTNRQCAATGTFVFETRRNEAGGVDIVDDNLFTPCTKIFVLADFVDYTEEIFRGYVKAAKPKFPVSPGEATFEVDIQDESIILEREHIREKHGDKSADSDKQILEKLASKVGLKLSKDCAEGQQSRILGQDKTSICFLRERAKANGYELLFEEGEIYFGPWRLDSTPQPTIMVYAGRATNCLEFNPLEDALKPNKIRFDLPPRDKGTKNISDSLETKEKTLGQQKTSECGNKLPPYEARISRNGDETEEETRARVQALADENAMKLKATGKLDGSLYGHVLKVAQMVSVDGVGSRFGGLWYVDKVAHEFSSEGYKQNFELIRNATGETSAPTGPLSAASSIVSVIRSFGG
ncbi:MAG: hypothetical protein V3R64_08705 [Sphingomonadales bacterium]